MSPGKQGREMSTAKRARIKAAQHRDHELARMGGHDLLLRSELEAVRKEKPAADWRAVVERVKHDAERPSATDHQRAVVALGALRAMGEIA